AETEVKPRYGAKPFQRDPETAVGKTAPLGSFHPKRDNRSYAGWSTPCSAAWGVHADCDAFEPDSRCALRPPTRRAERFSPGRAPTCATPPGPGGPAAG